MSIKLFKLKLGLFFLAAIAAGCYFVSRADAAGKTAPTGRYNVQTDVIYGHKCGEALIMDVFTPKKNANGAAIIHVVSGGWVSDPSGIPDPNTDNWDQDWTGTSNEAFLSRGYTVFDVMHGSQPDYAIPDAISDIDRSVRYIRYHAADFSIDPNRIGITGASAGGHLSLMQGLTGGPGDLNAADPVDRVSSRVQAVACFFPPTDFLNYGSPGVMPFAIDGQIGHYRASADVRKLDPATRLMERLSSADYTAMLAQISPINHVSADSPPTLVFHATTDPLVPLQQDQEFIDKMKSVGVPSELIIHQGGGHGWVGIRKDEVTETDWFDKYLATSVATVAPKEPPTNDDFLGDGANSVPPAAINALKGMHDFNRTRDVIYGHVLGVGLTMDVFSPKKHANGAAVVAVDSSGWFSDHSQVPMYFWYLGHPLVKRGYTVFVVVPRSAPRFTMDAMAKDVDTAVRYIRYHASDWGIDPNRIGITGSSAGAHLALLQATDGDDGDPAAADPIARTSSRVQAVACFFPPSDFLNYGALGIFFGGVDKIPAISAMDFREFDKQTYERERVSTDKYMDMLKDLSPITHVTAACPPTLIMHGDADPLVPIEQSEAYIDKLQSDNVPAKLVVKQGAGHGWPSLVKDDDILADWFDKYIGQK